MDFFKAQDAARRRTWQLGLLFVAAVLTLVLLTNLLVGFMFFLGGDGALPTADTSTVGLLGAVPAGTWGLITVGVLGIVGVATLYKYFRLRGGGRVVAESFGGRLVTREQADFKEVLLLNVVEEMAIASGTPVPPVYVLDEPGINAFAAGHSIEDAVIGVNRGTVETLTRDELQGVIAHEFSHILNGDMRLNLRLIAVLHGILFIGLIGRAIARAGGKSRKNGIAAIGLGLSLVVIGYGGTFFGNVIKAAVSRQREFLADAAAVQFTRNPGGIAGALKKIGGFSVGSTVNNNQANEASHLFFRAVAARRFLSGFFSTHPPLDVRIRSIEPRWSGQFPVTTQLPDSAFKTPEDARTSGLAPQQHSAIQASEVSDAIVSAIGNPDDAALTRARLLLQLADKALTQATHEVLSATTLTYAMLLSADDAIRTEQLSQLAAQMGPHTVEDSLRHFDVMRNIHPDQKITLLAMSIPALKTQSTAQYRLFQQQIARLANHDTSLDLFEWLVCVTLIKDLTPHFTGVSSGRVRFSSSKQVQVELLSLFASLAATAESQTGARRTLVDEAFAQIGLKLPNQPLPNPDFNAVSHALSRLRMLAPLQKPKVLKAMVKTLAASNGIDKLENALLHLLAGALDCPVPAQVSAHA
ncbi:MAG: M48 family metallopeptidase [Gammaproteobacteria bacterium]|nr:M48 family metallopeptidase [Gammaproteobacteria bacterium]